LYVGICVSSSVISFFDDFLTLAFSTSNFNSLGTFAWFVLKTTKNYIK
jgi:hypothetical protein